MDTKHELFDSLAAIVTYPAADYLDVIGRSRELLVERHSTAVNEIDLFFAPVKEFSTGEFEELFTRTFDINPVSSLELGWHLHGETYERGAFLVKMRSMLRQLNIEESVELPDHLSLALKAFGRMESSEAATFAAECLKPALKKMLEGFTEHTNPYEHVLRAVVTAVAECNTVEEGAPAHVNL